MPLAMSVKPPFALLVSVLLLFPLIAVAEEVRSEPKRRFGGGIQVTVEYNFSAHPTPSSSPSRKLLRVPFCYFLHFFLQL